MRIVTVFLASLLVAAPAAAAADAPLRHVEYTVTTQVDGRASTLRLALDLVGTTADRGVRLEISEPDDDAPVRVDVDRHGAAYVESDGALSREASLLCYFFALGSQNMTGLDRGDAWSASDARFRVMRKPADGRLDIAFTRWLDGDDEEHADYHGRLLYDAFKVVPLGFDATGQVRSDEDGVARTHDVRLVVRLIRDSQQ